MALATDRESIARHCVELIAKAKQLAPEQVHLTSSLEDLHIDSLDKVSLSFDVEEAYGIAVPDSALASVHTVGDIVAGVANAVEARLPAAATPSSITTSAVTRA